MVSIANNTQNNITSRALAYTITYFLQLSPLLSPIISASTTAFYVLHDDFKPVQQHAQTSLKTINLSLLYQIKFGINHLSTLQNMSFCTPTLVLCGIQVLTQNSEWPLRY